jgi:hypothetical protein
LKTDGGVVSQQRPRTRATKEFARPSNDTAPKSLAEQRNQERIKEQVMRLQVDTNIIVCTCWCTRLTDSITVGGVNSGNFLRFLSRQSNSNGTPSEDFADTGKSTPNEDFADTGKTWAGSLTLEKEPGSAEPEGISRRQLCEERHNVRAHSSSEASSKVALEPERHNVRAHSSSESAMPANTQKPQ